MVPQTRWGRDDRPGLKALMARGCSRRVRAVVRKAEVVSERIRGETIAAWLAEVIASVEIVVQARTSVLRGDTNMWDTGVRLFAPHPEIIR